MCEILYYDCCEIERFNYTKVLLKSNNNINFVDSKDMWNKEQLQPK